MRTFQCCTVCTGQRQCPTVAQLIAVALAKKAIRLAAASDVVFPQVYIDNVRFASDNQFLLEKAWKIFCDLSAAMALFFDSEEASPNYSFLGVVYNHNHGSITVSKKSLEKLQQAATIVFANRHVTLRQLIRVFGSLIWASRILKIVMAPYYAVFKNIRRRADRPLDEPFENMVWPAASVAWKQWIINCLSNKPTSLQKDMTNCHQFLFTDASLSGWGAIYVDDVTDRICLAFGAWSDELVKSYKHINVLEAHALLYGLAAVPSDVKDHRLHIFVDNTAMMGAVCASWSPSFNLNACVLAINSELQKRDLTFTITWLPSITNIADILTRLPLKFERLIIMG